MQYTFSEIIKILKDKDNWEFTVPKYDRYSFKDEVIYKPNKIVFFLDQTGVAFRNFDKSRDIVYAPGFFAYMAVTYFAIKLGRYLRKKFKIEKRTY